MLYSFVLKNNLFIMRNNEKLQIAIITPNLHGAGWERLLSEILPFLSSEFDIDLILYNKKIDYNIPGFINIISLNISTTPDLNLIRKSLRLAKRIIKTGIVLKRKKYDLIFSALDTCNVATFLAVKFFNLKIPLILAEQTINYNFFKNNKYAKKTEFILKFFLKKAYNSEIVNNIIVPSIDVKYYLVNELDIPSQKISIIPNAIDTKKFKFEKEREKRSLQLEKKFLNAKKKIIHIGRFDGNKRQDFILEIFKEIKKVLPEVKLFFFGKGNREEYIHSLVKKEGLENEVFFMGWKTNIEEYIKRADLLIHTSNYESFGNVIIEALACGIPVITSLYGLVLCQFKNILKDCKFLQTCDKDDKKCFVTKVIEILKNPPSLQEKEEISKKIHNEFSREKIAQKYVKIIKQCAV